MSDKSILELYREGEWSTYPKGKNLDKTPISADGGVDLIADETLLEKARRGKINTEKYSDRVEK